MRPRDWGDDWSEELFEAFREHESDTELIAQIREALLAAHAAGEKSESLFATNCDAANKYPKVKR